MRMLAALSLPDNVSRLSEYYSKLVQVGLAERVAEALQGEIFHHLNNGATVLMRLMTLDPRLKHRALDIIPITGEVAKKVTPAAIAVMEQVAEDKKRKPEGALLFDLLSNPSLLTEGNFQVLCANHDRLGMYADSLISIRTDAEIEMMERSACFDTPITLDRLCGDLRLSEVYNKITSVQTSVKVVNAYRSEIVDHMAQGSVVIKDYIRTASNNPGPVLEAFTAAEQEIVGAVTTRMVDVTAPISIDVKDMNVPSLRLVTLLSGNTPVTQKDYFGLCAFNDRLEDAKSKMFTLRKDTEVDLLRAANFLPPGFSL